LEHREINDIIAPDVVEIEPDQVPGHRQQVLTLMLERARVEVRGRVFGRMIVIQPTNESEIQSRHAVFFVDREIGIVGHDLIDGAGQ
jgi:hypothetical protein